MDDVEESLPLRMQLHRALLKEQAKKIVQSGALGRSRSYARLLEFLVECADSGRIPKELEVAIGADFDPSQDSMVRVYAHNLRQKLEHYYATAGRGESHQIVLARGEYRVALVAATGQASAAVAAVANALVPAPAWAAS